MSILYHIVPNTGGYYYIAKSENDEHYAQFKGSPATGTPLEFTSAQDAQDYIDAHLTSDYHPEGFWRNDGCACPECGDKLKVMTVVEAEKTQSGFTESLATCTNEACATDWTIESTKAGTILTIKRHYWR